MTVVDYIIILALLFGGVAGAKNGFFKQSVVLIGTILCFMLAWIFKNPLADLLSFALPFWNFAGPFEGLTSLNIVLYQLLAFMLLLILITSVLAVVVKVTGLFEKILKMTIILGIPSKILGFFVGVIEAYIIVFAVLFFLHQPALNIGVVEDSKFEHAILNSSPGLSNIVSNMNDSINDTYEIHKTYQENKNKDEFNRSVIDTLLEHNVINEEYVDKLVEKGKINY